MAPQQPTNATLALQQAVHGKAWDSPAKPPHSPPCRAEIQLALQYLQHDRRAEKAARTACGAVHDLLLTEEDCQAALDADAVPLLTAALGQHGASPAVMANGLGALLVLATQDRALAQLAHLLFPLVCAARQHKSSANVMALIISLFVQLATTNKGRQLLFTARAVDLAIDAMLTHPKDAQIQSLGCGLLSEVAAGPILKQQLLAMGAVETVVEAVRRFLGDRKVLQQALPTLCELCDSDEARTAVGRIGGVVVLLRAVQGSYEDPVVARYGCAVLWELMLCPSVRQKVLTTQIKALVKQILNHHAHRE
eukprot:EG_transcript_15566